MFWPRCVATTTKILHNRRKFKLWTFRGYHISSKTGYRRGVVLPLNAPSHKQGRGKNGLNVRFCIWAISLQVRRLRRTENGKQTQICGSKYFRWWRWNTQEGEKTKTTSERLPLCWLAMNIDTKKSFSRRFSFLFFFAVRDTTKAKIRSRFDECVALFAAQVSLISWTSSKQTSACDSRQRLGSSHV